MALESKMKKNRKNAISRTIIKKNEMFFVSKTFLQQNNHDKRKKWVKVIISHCKTRFFEKN